MEDDLVRTMMCIVGEDLCCKTIVKEQISASVSILSAVYLVELRKHKLI